MALRRGIHIGGSNKVDMKERDVAVPQAAGAEPRAGQTELGSGGHGSGRGLAAVLEVLGQASHDP